MKKTLLALVALVALSSAPAEAKPLDKVRAAAAGAYNFLVVKPVSSLAVITGMAIGSMVQYCDDVHEALAGKQGEAK